MVFAISSIPTSIENKRDCPGYSYTYLWVFKTGWLGRSDGGKGLGPFLGIRQATIGVTPAVEMLRRGIRRRRDYLLKFTDGAG